MNRCDERTNSRRVSRTELPRARGDEPVDRVSNRSETRAAPRARG